MAFKRLHLRNTIHGKNAEGPFKKQTQTEFHNIMDEKQTEIRIDEIEFELPYSILGKLF